MSLARTVALQAKGLGHGQAELEPSFQPPNLHRNGGDDRLGFDHRADQVHAQPALFEVVEEDRQLLRNIRIGRSRKQIPTGQPIGFVLGIARLVGFVLGWRDRLASSWESSRAEGGARFTRPDLRRVPILTRRELGSSGKGRLGQESTRKWSDNGENKRVGMRTRVWSGTSTVTTALASMTTLAPTSIGPASTAPGQIRASLGRPPGMPSRPGALSEGDVEPGDPRTSRAVSGQQFNSPWLDCFFDR